jgi:hypothetical protein
MRQPQKTHSWAANKVAEASPYKGVQGGLICENVWTIAPEESLQTAACTEKERLMTVS